jgi:hypothetical protein
MWATSVMFNKLSRVNTHPLGEFSANMVTLKATRPTCVGTTAAQRAESLKMRALFICSCRRGDSEAVFYKNYKS